MVLFLGITIKIFEDCKFKSRLQGVIYRIILSSARLPHNNICGGCRIGKLPLPKRVDCKARVKKRDIPPTEGKILIIRS